MEAAGEGRTRTESLYFRGSARLREDAEQFGLNHGLTLSSALALLTERGLEAQANERSIRELEGRVQQLGQALAVLRERDRSWQAVFGSLQGQLQTLRVGKCPACAKDVTASDSMLVHRCPWPDCAKPLQQVIPASAEEFPPALAALAGAVGGLLLGLIGSDNAGRARPPRIG